MNVIGVDYGRDVDIATYAVMIKNSEGKLEVADVGRVKDFDYTKYVSSEHQIVREKEDLEKFRDF